MTRHFLVIGAQRCGTTWLQHQLEAHPDITFARPTRPEPKVFLRDLGPEQDRAWYDATFFGHAVAGQVLGEKSTSYLDTPAAIDRVKGLLGDVPLIAQLRDPVARAISHWQFSERSGLEQRSLDEAIAANLEGPSEWDPALSSVSPYAYLERGRYVDALRPWLDAFGDRLRLQVLEEMLEDPRLVDDALAHLGVTPSGQHEVSQEPVNQSTEPTPALDPVLLDEVRQYFSDSNRELEALLGRPVPWADPAG